MKRTRRQFTHTLFGIVLGFIIVTVGSFSIDRLAVAGKKPGAAQELPLKDVQRFTTAISQIKNYYVEPVSDAK